MDSRLHYLKHGVYNVWLSFILSISSWSTSSVKSCIASYGLSFPKTILTIIYHSCVIISRCTCCWRTDLWRCYCIKWKQNVILFWKIRVRLNMTCFRLCDPLHLNDRLRREGVRRRGLHRLYCCYLLLTSALWGRLLAGSPSAKWRNYKAVRVNWLMQSSLTGLPAIQSGMFVMSAVTFFFLTAEEVERGHDQQR